MAIRVQSLCMASMPFWFSKEHPYQYIVNTPLVLTIKYNHYSYLLIGKNKSKLSVESQKGAITIQRCSVEKHKGAINIQRSFVKNQNTAIAIDFVLP